MVMYVHDQDKASDKPCWVGFYAPEYGSDRKIPYTEDEAEAGVWILRGWDVGFLAKGLAEASEIKWLT